MVRKRSPLDRIERMTSKKRSSSAISENDISLHRKKDKNLLNDRILSLYKEDISVPDKSLPLKNEEELPHSDPTPGESKQNKEPKASKTSSKVAKSTEKKKSSVLTLKHSTITFDDVGGLDKLLMKLLKLCSHMMSNTLISRLGVEVQPLQGFLLHGPPGCGKTLVARAIAGELCLPYIEVAATELVCGISGESENKIRDMFDEAAKSAPCILFIDEIDAVSPKRGTTDRGMENRMVAQLLKSLDELNEKESKVIVIGATNRPDSMDQALRRGGRFGKELAIGMPDESARLKILQVLCKNLKFAPDFDMQWLAHHTPGYVGADLKSLISEALEVCIWRINSKFISSCYTDAKAGVPVTDIPFPDVKWNPDSEIPLDLVRFWFKSKFEIPESDVNIYFEMQDFQIALENCVPYSKREGFAMVPDVTWDDVGALKDIQKQLQKAIVWPVKYTKFYKSSYMSSTKGILLYGPKGCGKTLLAKAIANECSINFLSVKGPELLSMYVGESERSVRQCFQRAADSAPCVIFFDEIDALCPKRSGSTHNPAADRVVNQLLTEMDGMGERKQVFVMGATNRLDKIDSAMLRPGRFEKVIYVDIPTSADRVEILKSLTKNKTRPKIADNVDLEVIGLDSRCDNFSGADLAYLLREATSNAMDERLNSKDFSLEETLEIKAEHFEHALSVVKPSITEKDREYFRKCLIDMS